MLIGELAERAATSTRTLRHYESRGQVRPRRSADGYRVLDRLAAVRQHSHGKLGDAIAARPGRGSAA